MNWISLGLQILMALPKLMNVAETAFDGIPDSSADKKKMVKTAVQAIVSAITGVSTGGQGETWKRIDAFIDPIIDIICPILFKDDEKAAS